MKLSDIVYKFINSIPKVAWKFLAIFIVIFASGPGLAFTYELISLINLLGADIFVLVYLSGFFVLLQLPALKIKEFFQKNYCLPSSDLIKEDKRYLLFLFYPIPSRAIEHFRLAGFVLCTFIGTIYILPWELINGS